MGTRFQCDCPICSRERAAEEKRRNSTDPQKIVDLILPRDCEGRNKRRREELLKLIESLYERLPAPQADDDEG